MKLKEFFVKDFGALGDGVTNDGFAICDAVQAAIKYGGPAVIHFEKATYRITEIPTENNKRCLFSLSNVQDLSIKGNNATLLFKGAIKLLSMVDCARCSLDGFVIDYSPKPFVLGKVADFSIEDAYIDFDTQDDLGLKSDVYTPNPPCFGLPNRRDIRYHYFFERFEQLADNKYRINIRKNTVDRMKKLTIGDEFILPYIPCSHNAGGACTLFSNDGFTISNLRFYSHPEFGFDVRDNRGDLLFDTIVLKQEESSPFHLISWRDCFHVKDNVSPIVWDNCYIGPIGDDAFNLSCVHLDVKHVTNNGKTVECLPAEKGKTRDIQAGDEFIAYDLETGRYIGEGHVARVYQRNDCVQFDSDVELPLLKNEMQISFYKFANPGFVVKNSYIEGTVRARSMGTFENCKFNVFWVYVENEFFVEGPIPKNLTFKDCTFTTMYDDSEKIFRVGTIGKNGLKNCEHKCKNIRLENCKFLKGQIEVEEGNELIIV
jgi:hypothetical protein